MIVNGLVNAIVNFILFGIVVAIRRCFSKEGLDSFLIHTDRKGMKLFIEGIIVGIVLFAIYPVLIVMFNYGEITLNTTKVSNTIMVLISCGIGFLAVAVFEEALFRGYIFLKLVSKVSLTTALVISSVIFGGLHFMSYSSSQYFWIGLINATLLGILLCVLVIRSGSLMLAIGYHLAWNLTQELILGKEPTIINLSLEQNILTGASNIPETGLFITVILLPMAMYVFIRFKYINRSKYE